MSKAFHVVPRSAARIAIALGVPLATIAVLTSGASALPPGQVMDFQKISDTEGGFTATLSNDEFGAAVAPIGDLDGDGVVEIAVSAVLDDDGGPNRGAVYMLFLNTDGTVKSHQKISDTEGGFTGTLGDTNNFGHALEGIGDLDRDGVRDLAVGLIRDDDGGSNRGAVYVLFLNADGTVKSHQKISDTEGGFTATLDNSDHFGESIADLGDLDGDGVHDLAVGASADDDGGSSPGAVYILFMNASGTVKAHQKISQLEGGFTGTLNDNDTFGSAVSSLGDLDGDGLPDLAVGAEFDDDGGFQNGAAWILLLNVDGTVKANQKISRTSGGFTGIHDGQFGQDLDALGDLDGDGVTDLAVGAFGDDDGGPNHGAVWILFLNPDGTVKAHQKISDTAGNFSGTLETSDFFGFAVAAIGDLDGDKRTDLAVGAHFDDDGGGNHGAVYVLFLDATFTGCPWDLGGDGSVGFADLNDLLGNWGSCPVATACPWDFGGDGNVGFADLNELLSHWGACPGPSNDTCAFASTISPGPLMALGSTAGATPEFVPPCGGVPSTAPSRWYRTVGDGSLYTASLCNSFYDSRLTVFCDECADLECFPGNDPVDTCGDNESVTWCTEPGRPYLIMLHGNGGASGGFQFSLTSGGSCGSPPCQPVP